jgi:Zn-dependent metalloprotease
VFGVSAPGDLNIEEITTDDAKATHVLFTQKVGDLVVDDAPLSVHFDAQGGVDHVSGPFYPNLAALVVAPTVSTDAAGTTAKTKLAGELPAATITVKSVTTGIRIEENTPKYVHTVMLTAGRQLYEIWVDPASGAIVREISKRHTVVAASGQGIRQTRQFEIDDARNGVYTMKHAKTADVPALAVYNELTEAAITSKDPAVWEPGYGIDKSGLAVESIYKMREILAWWKSTNAWNSFDNKGGALDILLYGTDGGPTNAAWTGEYISINVGTSTVPPSADIDTLGHEFTHAVVEYTARLRSSNDCGQEYDAMNEGLADVFGELAARSTEGGDPSVLSDEFGTDTIIRSLKDPALRNGKPGAHTDKGADHMSNRQGECHADAGVVDLAWYLMTFGGSHPDASRKFTLKAAPLGAEDSRKLWWATLRTEIRGIRAIALLARKMVLAARNMKMPLEAPACAWFAVGALSADELRTSFNVDCNADTDAGTSDTDASALDSCFGRADGMYCSVINPHASFACSGQARSGGDSCTTSQRCTGPNGPGTTIQCQ